MTTATDTRAVAHDEPMPERATGQPRGYFSARPPRSATEVPDASDVETRQIEANAQFHTTLVYRITNPGAVVDATELFPDL